MSSDTYLWLGVLATGVFLGVLTIEGARRVGYDPRYHTGSELELGAGGWIVRGAFLVVGGGMGAYALGVHAVLGAVPAALLLAVFAVGNVVTGVFTPDPVRGYPPGARAERPGGGVTPGARIHDAAGPVMFVALFGACLALVGKLDDGWAGYTAVTAVVGLGLTVATARAYAHDAPATGLVQRALIGTYDLWIVLVGIHLASR